MVKFNYLRISHIFDCKIRIIQTKTQQNIPQVVIPICEDSHWYVLLICNPACIDSPPDERLVRGDPYFIVMDSLGGYHTSALSAMRSYLR